MFHVPSAGRFLLDTITCINYIHLATTGRGFTFLEVVIARTIMVIPLVTVVGVCCSSWTHPEARDVRTFHIATCFLVLAIHHTPDDPRPGLTCDYPTLTLLTLVPASLTVNTISSMPTFTHSQSRITLTLLCGTDL